MAQGNRNSAAGTFLKNLASGGMSIIPVVGPLLKEAIFGTINEIDAQAEAAKVDRALSDIQSTLEGQSADIAEVLDRLNATADFGDETKALVSDLAAVMRDVETAPVSGRLEQAVINFRISLIDQLNGLTNTDLNQLIVTLPGASGYVSRQGNPRDRVAALMEWAEGATGPGLAQLAMLVRRRFPNF